MPEPKDRRQAGKRRGGGPEVFPDAAEIEPERKEAIGTDQRHDLVRGGEEGDGVNDPEEPQDGETGEPVGRAEIRGSRPRFCRSHGAT